MVMMTNPGDMPLSYQILPAVDISRGGSGERSQTPSSLQRPVSEFPSFSGDDDSEKFEDLAGEVRE